jgi:hypothetical protein
VYDEPENLLPGEILYPVYLATNISITVTRRLG